MFEMLHSKIRWLVWCWKLTYSSSFSRYWSEKIWGNATASYNPYEASRILSVGTSSGSRVVDETKQRFVYEPGKSLLCVMTGKFGNGVTGIIKSMTYGGSGNALGFCQSGSSFGILYKNRLSETIVTQSFTSQSNWNLDKFDGTGPSKRILDVRYSQIYFMDVEWLGVGRVRFGLYQGGLPYYVHEFSHINELDIPYLGNPNLPIRFEIVNQLGSAQTSSMRHICSSIVSEGGSDNSGIIKSVDIGTASIAVGANSNCALLFLRNITGSNSNAYRYCATKITPEFVSILPTANVATKWQILLNPSVNNSGSLLYKPTGGFGAEYATGSAAITIINEGNVIMSGYIPASTNQIKTDATVKLDPFFSLGADQNDNRDTIVVALTTLGAVECPSYASLAYREIV